jgi:hypothetical protein
LGERIARQLSISALCAAINLDIHLFVMGGRAGHFSAFIPA